MSELLLICYLFNC
uniref:Uncharacterized protein n=1 Tax=Arundo donax TaxID=35708 RepID=A0A0A9C9P7_ARUDO